eukprot:4829950-Heterocapsa_arctica.AAC.1
MRQRAIPRLPRGGVCWVASAATAASGFWLLVERAVMRLLGSAWRCVLGVTAPRRSDMLRFVLQHGCEM